MVHESFRALLLEMMLKRIRHPVASLNYSEKNNNNKTTSKSTDANAHTQTPPPPLFQSLHNYSLTEYKATETEMEKQAVEQTKPGKSSSTARETFETLKCNCLHILNMYL